MKAYVPQFVSEAEVRIKAVPLLKNLCIRASNTVHYRVAQMSYSH